MNTWTVLVVNELVRHHHYEGTFDTFEAAVEHARAQAKRSRKFAYFEVWKGTPRKPLSAVLKAVYRGEV